MAAWTLTAQLQTGTLAVNATDRIWWSGASFGSNVIVNSYQDSTHISDASDTHRCTTSHVQNTKYIDDNHFSLNGGATTAFSTTAPATSQCGLKFNFSDVAAVATSSTKFFAYDGLNDEAEWGGVNFKAFEATGTTTPVWVSANGSGSALSLQSQAAATSHDFFIGTSVSPTPGLKSGKLKLTLVYV